MTIVALFQVDIEWPLDVQECHGIASDLRLSFGKLLLQPLFLPLPRLPQESSRSHLAPTLAGNGSLAPAAPGVFVSGHDPFVRRGKGFAWRRVLVQLYRGLYQCEVSLPPSGFLANSRLPFLVASRVFSCNLSGNIMVGVLSRNIRYVKMRLLPYVTTYVDYVIARCYVSDILRDGLSRSDTRFIIV